MATAVLMIGGSNLVDFRCLLAVRNVFFMVVDTMNPVGVTGPLYPMEPVYPMGPLSKVYRECRSLNWFFQDFCQNIAYVFGKILINAILSFLKKKCLHSQ